MREKDDIDDDFEDWIERLCEYSKEKREIFESGMPFSQDVHEELIDNHRV